ncbi:MAG: DUF736 family protein [Alphaproteobacteria bacterium]|nr:DUF736 family protein [Alphaproteobacteria bacterium]MDD9919048.1 DUF736 family protein [Alphaproteobacteria bacterium]
MSYKYGNLNKLDNDQWPYRGKIACSLVRGDIIFKKSSEKRSQGAPDYDIMRRLPDNGSEMVGKAWEKKKDDGELFFSMQFDGPHMDRPLNVSAFQDESNKGSFNIVWQRPRQPQGDSSGVAAE